MLKCLQLGNGWPLVPGSCQGKLRAMHGFHYESHLIWTVFMPLQPEAFSKAPRLPRSVGNLTGSKAAWNIDRAPQRLLGSRTSHLRMPRGFVAAGRESPGSLMEFSMGITGYPRGCWLGLGKCYCHFALTFHDPYGATIQCISRVTRHSTRDDKR